MVDVAVDPLADGDASLGCALAAQHHDRGRHGVVIAQPRLGVGVDALDLVAQRVEGLLGMGAGLDRDLVGGFQLVHVSVCESVCVYLTAIVSTGPTRGRRARGPAFRPASAAGDRSRRQHPLAGLRSLLV